MTLASAISEKKVVSTAKDSDYKIILQKACSSMSVYFQNRRCQRADENMENKKKIFSHSTFSFERERSC